MAYFLRNARTKLKHKGPKGELEMCQYCGLVIVNDSLFPFAMCTGLESDPHKPVAARKLLRKR